MSNQREQNLPHCGFGRGIDFDCAINADLPMMSLQFLDAGGS
jgi:hypothetical protein